MAGSQYLMDIKIQNSEEFCIEEHIFEGNRTNKEVLRPVVYADCERMVSRICKER